MWQHNNKMLGQGDNAKFLQCNNVTTWKQWQYDTHDNVCQLNRETALQYDTYANTTIRKCNNMTIIVIIAIIAIVPICYCCNNCDHRDNCYCRKNCFYHDNGDRHDNCYRSDNCLCRNSCDLRHSSSCDITIPILSALVLVHVELSNFRLASPAVVILARKRLKWTWIHKKYQLNLKCKRTV